MKRILFATLLVVPMMALAHKEQAATKTTTSTATTTTTTSSTATDNAAATKAAAAAGTPRYELTVDGMHCDDCVNNLTKQLEAMSNVEKGSVKVDLKGKKAMVTLKQGGKDAKALASLKEELNKALVSNGFEVKAVKVVQ